MSMTVSPAEITISSILELMVENGSVSLVGNITSSISLKILYINCMNVVNISRTAVPFIGLSGVLKRTDSVLMVKPVRSLRRQIYNIAIDDDNDGFISRILHFNMHFSAFQHLSGSFRADCIEQLTFER